MTEYAETGLGLCHGLEQESACGESKAANKKPFQPASRWPLEFQHDGRSPGLD